MTEIYLLPTITCLVGYLLGYYMRAILIKDQKIMIDTYGECYVCTSSADGYINIIAGPVEKFGNSWFVRK
jgi:hypothetical protein